MSHEESFIVLESTPTPSMVLFLESEENRNKSTDKIMETTTLIDSNNLNPLQANKPDSSGRFANNIIEEGLKNGSFVTMSEENASTGSAIEDVMQSTIPIDEVEMLQQLIKEQDRMKGGLQKKNVDLRNNIEDLKTKYCEQRTTIGMLEGVNEALQQALDDAEKRFQEQRELAEEEKALRKKQLEESQKHLEAERISNSAQLDELKKALSEKQSVLSIITQEIERLKQEKDEFVRAKSNNPDASGDSAEFVTREEHVRQIKLLQQEMSEFENKKQVYVNQLQCLRANLAATDKQLANNRVEMSRMTKDIELRDISLKIFGEQVNVLTAQLEEEKVQNKRISMHVVNEALDASNPSSVPMDSMLGAGWSVNIR